MTARLVRTYTSDWGCFVIPPEITVEMNEPTNSWWAHICNRRLLPAGEPKPQPANTEFWSWVFTQELAAGKLGATDKSVPVVMGSAAYKEGQQAAKASIPHWQNPYASRIGGKVSFVQWYGGWCHQMQLPQKP